MATEKEKEILIKFRDAFNALTKDAEDDIATELLGKENSPSLSREKTSVSLNWFFEQLQNKSSTNFDPNERKTLEKHINAFLLSQKREGQREAPHWSLFLLDISSGKAAFEEYLDALQSYIPPPIKEEAKSPKLTKNQLILIAIAMAVVLAGLTATLFFAPAIFFLPAVLSGLALLAIAVTAFSLRNNLDIGAASGFVMGVAGTLATISAGLVVSAAFGVSLAALGVFAAPLVLPLIALASVAVLIGTMITSAYSTLPSDNGGSSTEPPNPGDEKTREGMDVYTNVTFFNQRYRENLARDADESDEESELSTSLPTRSNSVSSTTQQGMFPAARDEKAPVKAVEQANKKENKEPPVDTITHEEDEEPPVDTTDFTEISLNNDPPKR